MQVSIDQAVEKSMATMENSAKAYLDNKGLKDLGYSYQKMDEGKILVFKFKDDVSANVADMKAYVQKALTDAGNAGSVDVAVYELNKNESNSFDYVLIGLAIAVVVIFAYSLIMEKLAAGLAVAFSSVLASVLFIALMGLTRLPAAPFVGATCAIATVVAAALSLVTANRYNSALKNAEKRNPKAIANKLTLLNNKMYAIVCAVFAVAAIGLAVIGIFGSLYTAFLGAQILIAGVVSTFAAYFGTPFIWTAVKSK
jgi:hypothetical protein